MKRWKYRPEGSTWGDWGDDDQLGRLNLITPKKVLEGIAEVKEGLEEARAAFGEERYADAIAAVKDVPARISAEISTLEAAIAKRDTLPMMAALRDARIPAGVVQNLAQVFEMPAARRPAGGGERLAGGDP